jgi:hypothetical protein
MTQPTLTTYGGRLLEVGYAGEIVDSNPFIAVSKINSAATAIDFGYAVVRSSADDTCKLPAADADDVIGISIRHATKSADSNGDVKYAQYESLPILQSGYMYVLAFENATRGDTVISVTASPGRLGSTTGGAAASGRVAMDGTAGNMKATWETTTTAAAIGIVRIHS